MFLFLLCFIAALLLLALRRAFCHVAGDHIQIDIPIYIGADHTADGSADLSGHKTVYKHAAAGLLLLDGRGHGKAGLIRDTAAQKQDLRQDE